MNGIRKHAHSISKCKKDFQRFSLHFLFDRWIVNHIIVIASHVINNRTALVFVNIAADVNILNFLSSHIIITHIHRVVIGENHNHINSNQNSVRSTNAVIFAIAANQNNSHAIIMYFSNSFFS